MNIIRDMKGVAFYEGCKFLKPAIVGRSAYLEERVAHLRDGKLYGDSSKVAIQCPERCYIL